MMITKDDMQERTRMSKVKMMEDNKIFAADWFDSNMEEEFYAAAERGKTYLTFHVPDKVNVEALRKVLGERGFRAESVERGSIYYRYNLPEPQISCHWFW